MHRVRRIRSLATAALAIGLALAFQVPAHADGAGSFDPTFRSDGIGFYPLGAGDSPSSRIDALAIQPDGKIVLAGYATDLGGHHAFLVARLTPDGSLDSSFGDGGTVVDQLGNGASASSEAYALAIQPDGKIVVGGEASGDSNSGFMAARFTPGGSYDSSFGTRGKTFAQLPSAGPDLPIIRAIAIQPDGQIVLAGTVVFSESTHGTDELFAARVNGSDGHLDSWFGTDGQVIKQLAPPGIAQYTELDALALQRDGKIVGSGFFSNGLPTPLIVRLNDSDGSLDTSFADAGVLSYKPFPGGDNGAQFSGLAVQPDGKIVAAGWAFGQDAGSFATVVRLAPPFGAFDSSFGSGGKVYFNPGSPSSSFPQLTTLAVQPDGALVVGGSIAQGIANRDFLVARLDGATGALDSSFGQGGVVMTRPGGSPSSEVNALGLQGDGKIVAAGDAGSQILVARLLGQAPPPSSAPNAIQGGQPSQAQQPPPPATTATVSNLKLAPSSFAAANAGGSVARATGTTIGYTDSAAGTATFTVMRPERGVKRGRDCVKRRRGRSGRSCTRYVAVGSFSHADAAGQNRFHFTGRVHRRKLAPGRYRLTARALLGGRLGPLVTTSFRIVR